MFALTFDIIGRGTISAVSDSEILTSPAYLTSGSEVQFAAIPASNYRIKEWLLNGTALNEQDQTYTVTVNEDTDVTVEFEYIGEFLAWTENSILHVIGLTPGEKWHIYTLSGSLLSEEIAIGTEATKQLFLQQPGIYVVQQGKRSAKIVFLSNLRGE